MILKEITDFFKISPPFNLLSPEQLQKTSEKVSVEFFPKDSVIFSKEGPPVTSLGIIRKGGIKINTIQKNGKEKVLDYRGKGESFGFLSLITGDKPWSNIIAIEDTIAYMIPREVILRLVDEQPLLREYFLKSFWIHFSDKAFEEMQSRHKRYGDGDRILYLSRVGDMISRDVIIARPDITIKEASRIMSKNNISSLIFVDEKNSPVGIVTLRDFRDKVLARDLDLSTPVSEIMSPSPFTVDAEELSFEALLMMISHNVHHLIVVENDALRGVVTNTDFMLLQGVSPISIVKSIEIQDTIEGLIPLNNKIDKIISTLINDGISAKHIVRILSNINDRFIRKIIFLNTPDYKSRKNGFSFFTFGSGGRAEQTFKTLWNAAIVYEDNVDNESIEYFKEFIKRQQGAYGKIGFSLIEEDPFKNGSPLCGSISDWEKIVKNAVKSDEPEKIIAVCKFLDMKHIFGNKDIIDSLRMRLYESIGGNNEYLGPLTKFATEQKTPLGFLNDHVIGRDGEHLKQLDLRSNGIYPIVDSIRVMALMNKIFENSTIGRLYYLTEKMNLLNDLKDDIISAFEFLLNLRIRDQIRKKERNLEMNDYIDPGTLSALEKRSIKEVFQIVARLQLAVENYMKNKGIVF